LASGRLPTAGGGPQSIDWRTGDLIFAGAGLDDLQTNSVRLDLNNRMVSLDGNKLSFNLNPFGIFKGSAALAGQARPVPFQGAIFQNTNIGLGSFWIGELAGQLYLGAPPPLVTNTNSVALDLILCLDSQISL